MNFCRAKRFPPLTIADIVAVNRERLPGHEDTGSLGWTLVELLVAAGLAVVVASIVASVFYAVLGGLAQSSEQAFRFHVAVSTVERIISEMETSPCDDTAKRVGGVSLRLEPLSGSGETGTGELWFMTRSYHDNDGSEPYIAQINYRLQPSATGDRGRQLVRQKWIVNGTLPQPPPQDEAFSEVVLASIMDFKVNAWTTNGWTGIWPPPNDTNTPTSPEIVRVIMMFDDNRTQPLAVTGTAWRVAAGSLPVD